MIPESKYQAVAQFSKPVKIKMKSGLMLYESADGHLFFNEEEHDNHCRKLFDAKLKIYSRNTEIGYWLLVIINIILILFFTSACYLIYRNYKLL